MKFGSSFHEVNSAAAQGRRRIFVVGEGVGGATVPVQLVQKTKYAINLPYSLSTACNASARTTLVAQKSPIDKNSIGDARQHVNMTNAYERVN